MTKIDIFSGFLGAGKTTLIKKMINESFCGETLVLIENEFGEIGIDGGFLKDAGITVSEMNSGCICCSLVGDFGIALKQVLKEFAPDRILIEPSGVGKLSDVIKAVKSVKEQELALNSYTAVVDAKRCKMYLKNFGEFFCDQIAHAKCIMLSHTDDMPEAKVMECVALLQQHNPNAVITTTSWDELSGKALLAAIEGTSTIEHAVEALEHEHYHAHHHDAHCNCHEHHHEHHHDAHCDCHEHHHEHHHDAHCDCHEHHHEHHHDAHCDCHEHHHEHHHDAHCDCHEHHHADEVFQSLGFETVKSFSVEALFALLQALADEETYGTILRAKGIVKNTNGGWLHFDYVPGSPDVRSGSPDVIGRICVIGAGIKEDAIAALLGI